MEGMSITACLCCDPHMLCMCICILKNVNYKLTPIPKMMASSTTRRREERPSIEVDKIKSAFRILFLETLTLWPQTTALRCPPHLELYRVHGEVDAAATVSAPLLLCLFMAEIPAAHLRNINIPPGTKAQ